MSKEYRNILTQEGYFEEYHENMSELQNQKAAYEATEKTLYEKYEINRYSSLESFQTSLYRYIKTNGVIWL